jgi:hypothetical protein
LQRTTGVKPGYYKAEVEKKHELKVILKSGDPIRVVDGAQEYYTTVDDVSDEYNFAILQPCHQGKMVELDPGREYRMVCVKSAAFIALTPWP